VGAAIGTAAVPPTLCRGRTSTWRGCVAASSGTRSADVPRPKTRSDSKDRRNEAPFRSRAEGLTDQGVASILNKPDKALPTIWDTEVRLPRVVERGRVLGQGVRSALVVQRLSPASLRILPGEVWARVDTPTYLARSVVSGRYKSLVKVRVTNKRCRRRQAPRERIQQPEGGGHLRGRVALNGLLSLAVVPVGKPSSVDELDPD
jgi:hypothetical protein